MHKRHKILYWIATLGLALGMLSTGVVQLFRERSGSGGADSLIHLGYPLYLLTLLGIWKMLGVAAVLMPKLPLLKEWAYAGFFFVSTGAIYSHLACGDGARELFGPVLLLLLAAVSWYYRPANRKSYQSEYTS